MNILSKDQVLGDFYSRTPEQLNQGVQTSKTLLKDMDLYRGIDLTKDPSKVLLPSSKNSVPGQNRFNQAYKPKTLDPVPWVLDEQDLPELKKGINQWTRLLPLVLSDLFNRQSLVRKGFIPGNTLWSTIGFEPAHTGTLLPSAPSLSFLRFDLVRSQGRWFLKSLGSEIPKGLGYALENRIIHSKSFPTHLKPDNLARLAPFFRNLKEQWFKSARTHKESPTIMVWTQGPKDPTYFEPVYLARYFGYPLVESRDLTVRSGNVYLKTLGGLEPVDILLRWVPDRSVDPLHGNPGGFAGVAGIMQSVRDGKIIIVNLPGSGMLEHPDLLSLLPSCSTYLIGEELSILPLPKSWEQTHELETHSYWTESNWENYPTQVSVFAAQFATSWEIMPGGIAQPIDEALPYQKDLWFLEPAPVPQISLLPPGESPTHILRAGEMPSRVADDLHWLGRYVERAWLDARCLAQWLQLDAIGGAERDQHWETLLAQVLLDTNGVTVPIDPDQTEQELVQTAESALVQSTSPQSPDENTMVNPQNWRLPKTISEINRISGNLLDRMSNESHRILRSLNGWSIPNHSWELVPGLEDLNITIAALNGLTMENMTRTSGWIFLDMGRRLERAEWIVKSMNSIITNPEPGIEDHSPLDPQSLQLLLDIFDSGLTYRTRYRLAPTLGPVVDLLLLDETNPRSLGFQILQLTSHITQLPRDSQRPFGSPEEKILLEVSTRLRLLDPAKVQIKELTSLFTFLLDKIDLLSQTIHQAYLAKIESSESIQLRYKEQVE
jgi:uncharacterized alpha-E superfamily protein